jgi:hypothetical protein
MPTQRRPKRLVSKPTIRITPETLALFRELKVRCARGDYDDYRDAEFFGSGEKQRERQRLKSEFINLLHDLDRPFDICLSMGIWWYHQHPNDVPRPDDPKEIRACEVARLLEEADRSNP